MINVIIVDDHPIFREGLKKIIGETTDIRVAGEAEDGERICEKVRSAECDVLVMDISLPGRNGLEVIREIRKQCPGLPVLFLSMHSESKYARQAFKAGAAGYLTKLEASRQLVRAIRRVLSQRVFVCPSFEELECEIRTDGEEALPHEKLSGRELEVMMLMIAGKKPREIADELSLSVKTVGTYRTRILEKVKLESTADLTAYAMAHGLLEP